MSDQVGLDTSFVRGMFTGIYVGTPAARRNARALFPAPATFTVDEAASAGATTLTLTAPESVSLPENTVLNFGGVYVMVTETTSVGTSPTPVPVSGLETEGLPDPIAADEEAVWHGLMRVMGTTSTELSLTEGTSNLTSTTYDSGMRMEWDEIQITSKGWTLPRQGNFKPTDPAYLAIREAGLKGLEIPVLRILPDENGDPAEFQRGRSLITGFSVPAPADGIVTASWTFTGQGRLEVGPIDDL